MMPLDSDGWGETSFGWDFCHLKKLYFLNSTECSHLMNGTRHIFLKWMLLLVTGSFRSRRSVEVFTFRLRGIPMETQELVDSSSAGKLISSAAQGVRRNRNDSPNSTKTRSWLSPHGPFTPSSALRMRSKSLRRYFGRLFVRALVKFILNMNILFLSRCDLVFIFILIFFHRFFRF